ncbi:hypothetical protein BN874_1140023 [Candidatus Contendobacter odensis Run_B_J11]|uniref:Uncharacterized protein n=1 Tax=Candidatus Contendobacter odensis Run_B_J11 TaxID=1400861 RepID=A0A7U7J2F7_9GAMM|nr:hypothetical protein BN874_1140023 [Candidatus Contendobacter odensis Run_B_J11]
MTLHGRFTRILALALWHFRQCTLFPIRACRKAYNQASNSLLLQSIDLIAKFSVPSDWRDYCNRDRET